MKQRKPTPSALNTTNITEPLSNTRFEDWIDKIKLMKKFNISFHTVDYYIERGVLQHTSFGVRKYFYLPNIIRSLEMHCR